MWLVCVMLPLNEALPTISQFYNITLPNDFFSLHSSRTITEIVTRLDDEKKKKGFTGIDG